MPGVGMGATIEHECAVKLRVDDGRNSLVLPGWHDMTRLAAARANDMDLSGVVRERGTTRRRYTRLCKLPLQLWGKNKMQKTTGISSFVAVHASLYFRNLLFAKNTNVSSGYLYLWP